jgi:amino acid adenylation domain-containing protein
MNNLSELIANLSAERRELLGRMIKERETDAAGLRGRISRRRDPEALSPLSFAQERLWFLHQLNPAQATYNAPIVIRLRGPFNLDAFKNGIAEIVRRHSVLRATFETIDGKSVQKIGALEPIDIPIIDLRSLAPSEREAEARRLLEEKALAPFDLGRGPLLRVSMLRLGDEERIALILLHHIIFDGWSLGIFLDELMTLYGSCAKDDPSPLPDPPAQYSDFAQWQRERLTPQALEAQLDFWKRRLGSSIPVLQLPLDRPRPAVQTFAGSRMTRALPQSLAQGLKALSQREGVTLFMTLLALYKTLLFRHSGQTDIFIGTVIANRLRPEWERLIGFFANTVVLRADLSGDPSFRELLRRVRSEALEAYEYQETPFEQIVSALRPERDPSHSPLFQTMFVMQESSRNFRAPELVVELLDPPFGVSKFDLALDVRADEDELDVTLEYNTDLFDHATAAQLLNQFQTLAANATTAPETALSRLLMLTEEEWELILSRWNQTEVRYRRDLCVHQIFEEQVARRPDGLALNYGDDALTYEELNRRSNQLARYLRKLGVGPESMVGICVERSIEMVVGVLGALKSGGAYAPLDPTYPQERLSYMIEDSGARVLLTQRRLLGALPVHKARVVCLDADWDEIAAENEDNPVNLTGPSNLAYMIFTSGSTGVPKGVALAHEGLSNLTTVQRLAFDVGEGNRVLQFSSISFDGSVLDMVMALTTGATLCRGAGATSVFDGAATLHTIREKAITTAILPTAALSALPSAELPELRTVITGGESCTNEIVARWAGGRDFINAYGPTESTVFATMKRCDPADGRTPSIGRPIANTEVFILDQHAVPAPIGAPGELYVGGVGLARGYHGRPDLTAEKFVPHPFAMRPGARLYRTGDLVRYLPDGNIDFLGRMDFQVKVRGFRIELGEIESMLNKHPAVRQSLVVAREQRSGEKRLIAYVVVRKGESLTVEELRGFLKKKLPQYMAPSAFALLDAFPLTPGGKVDRQALPNPDGVRPDIEAAFVTPHTEIEREVAEVWREILGVERVGVNDNFFDLGGDSLRLLQLQQKLQERLRSGIPLMTLFKYPTVSAVARQLGDGGTTEEPPSDRAQKQRMMIERRKKSVRRRPQA